MKDAGRVGGRHALPIWANKLQGQEWEEPHTRIFPQGNRALPRSQATGKVCDGAQALCHRWLAAVESDVDMQGTGVDKVIMISHAIGAQAKVLYHRHALLKIQ